MIIYIHDNKSAIETGESGTDSILTVSSSLFTYLEHLKQVLTMLFEYSHIISKIIPYI